MSGYFPFAQLVESTSQPAQKPSQTSSAKQNNSEEVSRVTPSSRPNNGHRNNQLKTDVEDSQLFLQAVGNLAQRKPSPKKAFTPPLSTLLQQNSQHPQTVFSNNQQPTTAQLEDSFLMDSVTPQKAPSSTQKHLHPPKHLFQPGNLHVPKQATATSTSSFYIGEADDINNDPLFAKAMQGVLPLQTKGRDIPKKVDPKQPTPANIKTALELFLDGSFEFTVANTEEYCEGFVSGIDPVLFNKLKAGNYSPEKHVDLHGKNSEQAYDALLWFIKDAYQRNLRTVLIITGKGKNSPEGIGVLRLQVQDWLTKAPFKRVVMAFCSAKPCDGGAGALYVLLRKFKKSTGKITWERIPSSDDFAAL